MKKMVLCTWMVVLIAVLFMAGCGKKVGSTPEDTFNAFHAAIKNDEFEKIYDLLSSKEQKQMDTHVDEVKKILTAHFNKQSDKEALKKYGVTDEKIKNMTGKDVMRVNLAIGQVMTERYAPKGKPAPNTLQEMKDEISKAKLMSAKVGDDGKTAVITVQNAKGKTEESKMILENGQWKMDR